MLSRAMKEIICRVVEHRLNDTRDETGKKKIQIGKKKHAPVPVRVRHCATHDASQANVQGRDDCRDEIQVHRRD